MWALSGDASLGRDKIDRVADVFKIPVCITTGNHGTEGFCFTIMI